MSGKFITVEGIEGAGKSTIVQAIAGYLRAQQLNHLCTREPGGTDFAEAIRALLLKPVDAQNASEGVQPETELLLMFACRAQHVAQVIQPALAAGTWVVSDRFIDASYAYQGYGRGMDERYIAMLDHWIAGRYIPDLTLLLDIDPALGLQRAQQRGQQQDRIEQEKLDFFMRVRAGYLARAEQFPARIKIIDAARAPATVQADVHHYLEVFMAGTV